MVLGNCISDHEGNHIRQRHRCRKRSRDLHTTESWLSQSRVVTLIDSLWCFGKKVLDYPNWESRYIRLSMDWISESPSWVPLILLSVIHGLSQEIFARSAKHTPNPELNDSLLDLSWRETSCIYSVDVLTKLYSKSWLMEKAFLSIYQSSSFKPFKLSIHMPDSIDNLISPEVISIKSPLVEWKHDYVTTFIVDANRLG